MANAYFEVTKDGITAEIRAMIQRGRSPSSYMQRITYPKYINAQIQRWQSENTTQGPKWEALSPAYAKRKKRKFATYPGAGNVLMVATGRLADASQGRKNALKMITDRQMRVGVDVGALPYAVYPGLIRPFMEFSDATIQKWVDGIARYVMTGEVK